ncbi:MAG: ferritin [Firmicutes bacterium]|nr:ferritin [Bacillota bacterium]
MISKHLNEELNQQITYEFYSSHLYLAMSAKLASIDFIGAATWMRTQAEEERVHALKIVDYILETGGEVNITGFEDPDIKADNILGIFEQGLEHEKFVTDRINFLMGLATEEKNYAAINFLNWFVNEQVEEESNAETIIRSLKLIGNDGNGLYQIDKELGARTTVGITSQT